LPLGLPPSGQLLAGSVFEVVHLTSVGHRQNSLTCGDGAVVVLLSRLGVGGIPACWDLVLAGQGLFCDLG
jgi:hypothetical protein